MRELLDDTERERGAVRERLGERLGATLQLTRGKHAIDPSPGREHVGRVQFASDRDRSRPREPRPRGDPLDPARERDDAEPRLR